MVITPHPVAVPDDALDDLRDRLRRTRWPEAETVDDWSQGIPLAYVQELCSYWADGYDWRPHRGAPERARPSSRTEIDGLGIHFLHVRSPHPDALPLVITHGWPGSVVEFLDVIGPLADPPAHGGDAADAFHVVVPVAARVRVQRQADGTGLGRRAHRARRGPTLMGRLGYDRYGAQGGDWGAAVTAHARRAGPRPRASAST